MSNNGIGSQVVTQIGIIVRDIEASIEQYCAILGLEKPPVIVTDPYDKANTRYRGQPTEARAKLAFFHVGQVDIELIEPLGGQSTWQEHLDKKGEGVHHIAFVVPDPDAAVAHLAEHGVPLIQRGDYTGGMYLYMDSESPLGVVLELLHNFAD